MWIFRFRQILKEFLSLFKHTGDYPQVSIPQVVYNGCFWNYFRSEREKKNVAFRTFSTYYRRPRTHLHQIWTNSCRQT